MSSQILKVSKETPQVIPIIKELLSARKGEIDAWFAGAFRNTEALFYNSVDLRHSGFKLAPVDTNLFPAGFNNLTANERIKAAKTARNFFDKYHPDAKNVLLISEDHTRNTFYLENIAVLKQILRDAGRTVVLSSFNTSRLNEDQHLESHSGIKILSQPIIKENGRIVTKNGFVPDIIIVNNDLTEGAPDLIHNVSQPIIPPVGFGWYRRRKTSHFESYNNIVRDFCNQFGLDPWLISTHFSKCGVVNFKERKGIECVALNVEKVLFNIQKKYDEYKIDQKPYVFIKSDKGTYGMGIMTASSGDEVFEMGKKIRTKMNTIKGGTENSEVIIQEGIQTIDQVNGNPAEPMIYMIGGEPVGCIFRLNTKKDAYGNLNASGMEFTTMNETNSEARICESLALVSKLASYAAAWECYDASYTI